MKNKNQFALFDIPKKEPQKKLDKKYTSKIKAPVYEPKGRQPFPQELVDVNKYQQLLHNIESSNVTELEKEFLRQAAARHMVFSFEKIADYYAHASAEMQELMEESALVIIDFDKAIEEGYIKLSEEIADQFMEDSQC